MATPAAVLSILVKTEGAQVAGAQLNALDKSAKRSTGTLASLGAAAKSAGAAFGVAGLALGLKRSVDEAREAQKVGAQTNAVLKSTGGIARVTAKDVGNLANAISRKAGIDDEAIQKGENLLLTFKNIRNEAGQGRDIFNQATRAAVDLSVAGFGSLESTSKQLGKALNDPVKGLTALGRAGVTFSAQQKTAITALIETGRAADRVKAQQIILREVQSQVGGSAAAQATNMDKLRVSIGNVAESVGGVLVPVMDKAAAVLNSVIVFFQRSRTATTALIAVIAVLTTAWAAYKVQAIAAAAATTIATGGLNLIIPAIAALATGIIVADRRSKTFRDTVNSVFSSVRTTVTGAISKILGGFSSMLTAIGKVANAVGHDGLGNKALQGARAIDDLRDSLNAVPSHKDVEVAVKIKLDGQDVDVSKAKPLSPTPPGGDGPGVIGSRIADAVRSSKQVHDGAKKLLADGLGSMIPGIGGGGGNLMGAKAIMRPFAALGAQFGLRVSSGLRPGAITSSGNVSLHASGNAVDLANGKGPDKPKMAAFNALRSRYGSRLAELIYTPAGGRQIKNGQNFLYTGQVARDHYDHVHVGYTGGPAATALGQAGNRGDGLGKFMGDGIGTAIAAAKGAGFTGEALVRMVAIAGRESNYNPRAQNLVPPDHSIGLWQINQLAHHGRFGTDAQLMNPNTNARAAWILSGHGHNFSPWSTNRGLSQGLIDRARAAVAAFKGGTSTGGGGNSAAGSTNATGAASAAAKVNPFDQKIASADLAIEQAKHGAAKSSFGIAGIPFKGHTISSAMRQIGAMTSKRKLIGARIRSIRKALKGKLSPAKRLALTQELTQRLSEHAQLGTDIQALRTPSAAGGDGGSIGDIGGGTGDLGDGSDGGETDAQRQAREATEALTQALVDHMNEIQSLQNEIAKQNQIAGSTIGISLREAQRALADMISGQIGGYGGVGSRSLTAGAGNVVRY